MPHPTHPDYTNHPGHADYDPKLDLYWQASDLTARQVRHQQAQVRARKIVSRHPEVLSIYDLGLEISRLQSSQILAAETGELHTSAILGHHIARLKSLLPI